MKPLARSPTDRAAEDWIKHKFKTPEGVPVPLMWWFSKLHKGNIRMALADINEANGTNYPRRRYREWETGYTKLPENLRKYVIGEVLRAKLGKELAERMIEFLDLRFEKPPYSDFL